MNNTLPYTVDSDPLLSVFLMMLALVTCAFYYLFPAPFQPLPEHVFRDNALRDWAITGILYRVPIEEDDVIN